MPLVKADAVHVIERAALRGADVMQDRARRCGCCRTVRQTKALQREHAEMVLDLRDGVVGGEDPVVERSLGPSCILQRGHARRRGGHRSRRSRSRLIEQRQGRSEEHFARSQDQQFLANAAVGVIALELGGAKFASREIERRESHSIARARHAAQEVVLLGAEMRVGSGARREHPRDLALHQLLGDSRVLHLLADGDLESFANELGDVILSRVVGDTAHGYRNALLLVARGQRDLQFARGDHGVFEEQFVEIAETKEDERIGVFFFDRGILPHQGRGRLAHVRKLGGL